MWDWAIWGALIVSAACGAGALAYLAVLALRAWRDFKRTRRHLFRALERLVEQVDEVAESAAGAADTSVAMESLARLQRSLARFAVLREAVDEVRDTLGRFTAVMPRR